MTILYGTNPIAWSNDDDRSLGAEISLERCLAEAAAAGFDGIEKGHKLPDEPAALRAALAPHGLRFVSGWHSTRLLERSLAAEKQAIAPHLALLQAMGCRVCIVCETSSAIHGDPRAPISAKPLLPAERWPAFGAALTGLAEHLAAEGLTLAYHHHMGTITQSRPEIEALMAHSGPAVQLLLDTGHAAFAGLDPVALARRFMPRVAHLHCKNLRPAVRERAWEQDWSFLQAVRAGVFTVPGDPEGAVDFAAVLQVAAAQGYRGWLVVEAEQDPAKAAPLAYQSLGVATLRRLAREAGLEEA